MEPTIAYPTPEEVQRMVQAARRQRSEAVHAVLKSAGAWLADALRLRTPKHGGAAGVAARG